MGDVSAREEGVVDCSFLLNTDTPTKTVAPRSPLHRCRSDRNAMQTVTPFSGFFPAESENTLGGQVCSSGKLGRAGGGMQRKLNKKLRG